MGVLRSIGRKLSGHDEAMKLKRQYANSVGKSVDDVNPDEYIKFLEAKGAVDLAESSQKALSNATKPFALALGGGAVAGAGAYAYSSNQKSERYDDYLARVAAIEEAYERGDISYDEMQRRKEEAWNAYRRSNGDGSAGVTLPEIIADMSTIQLALVAGVSVTALLIFGPPLINGVSKGVDEFSLLEKIAR